MATAAACFLGFLLLLGFHGNLPTLNSTWLGTVGETYTFSPAGSSLYPFQDNAATIYTIANTGAMLHCGQERSRGICGLSCRVVHQILWAKRLAVARFSEQVSESYNHPHGVAAAPLQLPTILVRSDTGITVPPVTPVTVIC
jgi:hypothetical protein